MQDLSKIVTDWLVYHLLDALDQGQQAITRSNTWSAKTNFYHTPQQIGKHRVSTDTTVRGRARDYKCYFRYHFLHSLALFTVQFSSVPKITAALFIAGQLLFCVPAYSNGLGFVAIDDPKLYAMPFGGTSFMIGWASHAL